MDQHEKSTLLDTLMSIKDELRLSREERAKAQTVHVHLKAPRVSFDTVLLSLASGLIAAASFYACVRP